MAPPRSGVRATEGVIERATLGRYGREQSQNAWTSLMRLTKAVSGHGEGRTTRICTGNMPELRWPWLLDGSRISGDGDSLGDSIIGAWTAEGQPGATESMCDACALHMPT